MKQLLRFLAIAIIAMAGTTYASETFMHPSSWGLMTNDDDPNQEHYHYKTFTEDSEHACNDLLRPILGVCTEDKGYSFDDNGYALRGCGYGQHCSASKKYHAGIDYEVPNHVHDPDDYVNGQMKSIGLRQGKGVALNYHGEIDNIKASNDGVVVYSEEEIDYEFGNTIILRHICNPNTSNVQNLCVQENGEWIIYTQYSHMSKRVVSVGAIVSRGQKIGEIGGTGGEDCWIHHLHFEFKTNPVYHSPDSDSVYAYTDGNPTDMGYRDPMLFLGKVYIDDASDGCQTNPDGGQTCVIGDTTHIIHPNYRCSNNQCWQPGGETNCWDANTWYEINNGNVSDIVRYRDRNMCDEVYGSGDSYIPPESETITPGAPGSGGLNDMKIQNVTMSKGSKSERHDTLYQDPGEKFYAYAKITNSGSAIAYDFKVKYYIDGGNRNCNGDDEDYQDSVRVTAFNPGAEIRYAKELTSPSTPGTYWVYACITSINNDSDEGNNCSNEDDREEYGRLVVVASPEVTAPTLQTGKTWTQLTPGEQAAILQIL